MMSKDLLFIIKQGQESAYPYTVGYIWFDFDMNTFSTSF